VGLDVVGMAVAPALVVGHEDVGAELDHHLGQLIGGRSRVDDGKAAVGRARHARIGEPEHDALSTEDGCRLVQLAGPPVAQGGAGEEPARVVVTPPPVRRSHDDRSVALSGHSADRPAGEHRLVVGMGVEENGGGRQPWSRPRVHGGGDTCGGDT